MIRHLSGRVRSVAAAGAITLAGIGGIAATVNAQTPSGTATATTTPGAGAVARQQAQTDFINTLAQNLGVTADRLTAALKQTALQAVDKALAVGTITSDQAQRARDRINTGQGVPFGPGFGFGGGFDRGGRGGLGADGLATFLGITDQQLRDELNGKSMAQVAQAHGKTRDQLITFLVNARQQRLAADVTAGRITQAEADGRLTDYRTRVTTEVDQVRQPGVRGNGSGATGTTTGTPGAGTTPRASVTPTATATTTR